MGDFTDSNGDGIGGGGGGMEVVAVMAGWAGLLKWRWWRWWQWRRWRQFFLFIPAFDLCRSWRRTFCAVFLSAVRALAARCKLPSALAPRPVPGCDAHQGNYKG